MSLQIAAWEAKDGEKKPLPKKQVTSLLVSKLLFYSLLLSFFYDAADLREGLESYSNTGHLPSAKHGILESTQDLFVEHTVIIPDLLCISTLLCSALPQILQFASCSSLQQIYPRKIWAMSRFVPLPEKDKNAGECNMDVFFVLSYFMCCKWLTVFILILQTLSKTGTK